MQEIEDKLKQADMGFEVGDTQKLEAQYEKLSQRLSTLKQQQADLNRTDLSGVQKNIDKIGNSVSKTITKVGKWALAVFGVRSAYMFVRQAASTLSQYNEQIATDLEYMQFALASMLQPVIEGLIQLAYKLLTYVNYIAKAWFGVDWFANASAKAMNKSAKSAEKMKKSLAGFDEMNVISDNSTKENSSGGIPSMDLSAPEDIEIPSWIQWIADNKDLIIGALAGIAGALIAVQFGASALMGLGIGLIVAGIVLLVQDIIDFIKDPSWENFSNILIDLAIILAGVAIAMLAVNAANPVAWIMLAIAAVIALVAVIIKYWDEIKVVLGKVGAWIYDNIIKPVGDFFVGLWNGIKNGAITFWEGVKSVFSTIGSWIYTKIIKSVADFFVGLWDGIVSGVTKAVNKVKSIFNTIKTFFSNIITTIINLFKNIGTKVGNAISSAFKTVINGILTAIENILNFPIKSVNKLLDIINKVPGINITKLSTFDLPRLAVGGIVNMPGRGVPIGGAIAGEAGVEGVIPLTDSQAMETLGEAIGRYISVNLTNITKLDNRQIAREQKKINSRNDFAMNR